MKGKLLIIGGAEVTTHSKSDAYHSDLLISLYRNLNCKTIAIITAGGKGLKGVKEKYIAIFKKKLNFEVEFVVLHEQDDNEKILYKERLEQADSIFFTGGNQIQILELLEKTSFINLIKERYKHERIVIAGTSAGAMMLSEQMICDGSNAAPQINEYLKITPGMGLIPNSIIDTHFIQRGRITRLAHAINRYPHLFGIGLEENTALLLEGTNGKAQCFGSGTVTIMEEIKKTPSEHFKLNDKTIRVTTSFITSKDKINLKKL
ncbi:cyanophycinase [Legionella sp. PC997]|uniref:cyanophycinase n=1 Tax=Legionella sp. PC997 TaxID=2755562 RepID=UPI0015FACC81|nr:cyanophycinase [Legionella sp. PC997]QMT59764.1 cyanophycinase [Legionella sp. PC997]